MPDGQGFWFSGSSNPCCEPFSRPSGSDSCVGGGSFRRTPLVGTWASCSIFDGSAVDRHVSGPRRDFWCRTTRRKTREGFEVLPGINITFGKGLAFLERPRVVDLFRVYLVGYPFLPYSWRGIGLRFFCWM